jgi:pimeloyl-ACP methyl ester carboxylesterase
MTDRPEDKFIQTNHLRLHYLEWSGDSRRTLILLHGIGDTAHVWDDFAGKAAGRHRVLCLDQRGHGLSQWAVPPAYRCDDYVGDLERFVDALGLAGIVLMGHSMGALHATRFTALRPERVAGLVHADIEPRPPDWNRKYLLNLHKNLPFFYDSLDEVVQEAQKNSPHADRDMLLRIASSSLARGEDGKFRHRFDREVLSHFDRYDLWSCLRDIRCPALIVRGEESRVMGTKAALDMKDAIPGGRFAEIGKAAHPVHTENPAEFYRTVFRYLEETGFTA